MILRVAFFIFCSQMPAAFAGGGRATKVINHFQACRGMNLRADFHPPICSRKNPSEDLLQAGAELSDSLALSALVKAAQPSASALLNQSIEAREKMYACLDSSAPGCTARVAAFRSILERRVVAVRKALMLQGLSPSEIDPINASTADFEISLPAFAGSRTLPAPTPAEYANTERNRELIEKAYDRISVEDAKGAHLTHDQSVTYCTSHDDPVCTYFGKYRQAISGRVHAAGAEVARRILLEMPMAADFDHVPISKAELKASLTQSLTAMKKWRKEILDPASAGQFLFNYSDYAEPILKLHPEYCRAAEQAYAHAKSINTLKTSGLLLGKGLATLAACVYSGGGVCAGVAFASAVTDAGGNYLSERELVSRMTSLGNVDAKSQQELKGSDRSSDKLIKPIDVDNARRDLMVGLAFDSVALLPVGKELGLVASKLKSAAQPMGDEVEAIISEDGPKAFEVTRSYLSSNAQETGAQMISHVGISNENGDNMAETIYRALLLAPATP